GPGSTLAGVIALETGEASDLHLASLTALAIVLFVIAFIINALARLLVARSSAGPSLWKRTTGGIRERFAARRSTDGPVELPHIGTTELVPVSRTRVVRQKIAVSSIYFALLVGLVPLVAVLAEMLRKGLPAISWSFFTELQPLDPNDFSGGISNAIVGTL